MRWVIAVGVIAGCGRIGFDAPGGAGGGPGGDDTAGAVDAARPGDTSSAHYITGGSVSQSVPVPQVITTTGPLDDADMVVVVAIHWHDTSASVSTVLDTFGNGFSLAAGVSRFNGAQSQTMWFKRVTGETAIRVLFDQPAAAVDVKWAAYRDIDPSSGFGGSSAVGKSATADTGALTLDGPAVVVASSASRTAADAAAGPGFAQRHAAGGGVLEDREVTGAGAVNATVMLSQADEWIIQNVTLRTR